MVKKLKHIVIAISASLVLCAGFVPSVPSPFRTASAGEDIGFAGGSGTADDPYLVKTPEHLDNVRGHLDAHFRQVADIDLSGYTERQGWEPIRNRSETFKGTFDGSKYKISNLTINRRNSSYIGLFGIVDNTATVKRIGLENVDIVGKYEVGALAGRNMGKITECYVKGTIAGEGGIGGLVGNHQGNITYSYAKIDVFGGNYAGGMVGGNAGGRIEDCFVVGTVTGDTGVGSLVGRNMGKITGSYYDERIIGRDETDKGIPKTTEEMMIRETFEGWNFENVWKIDEEENYPYLQWEKWDKSDIPVLPAVEEKKAEKISDELKEPVRRVKSEIAERFAGGSGAEDDPYLLETPEQLDLVRNHLDAHFRQIADIDLSEYSDGKGWMPIGDDDNAFNGTVDGNGYKIVNLTINRPENSYVGFFGTLGQNSEVNNVSLKDVDVRGYRWSGALGGENEGKITSSNVDGKVKWGLVSGGGMVGGIVASNKGSIKNSFATVKLKGQYFVGGVVGENRGEITGCYSTGEIRGEINVGGIVGYNRGGIIANSYSTAKVSGERHVGGLVGSNRNREAKIVNCYSGQKVKGKAHVGGLVGINEEGALRGAVLNSYYDKNTTGRGDTGKGTPKTTEEMMRRETFEGWDFDDIWAISEGESSPYFQYQIQEEEKKSFWDRLPFF